MAGLEHGGLYFVFERTGMKSYRPFSSDGVETNATAFLFLVKKITFIVSPSKVKKELLVLNS